MSPFCNLPGGVLHLQLEPACCETQASCPRSAPFSPRIEAKQKTHTKSTALEHVAARLECSEHVAGVHSQKYLKMQCSRARFVSGGSRVLHYRSSGWCLKKQTTLCALPNPIPRPPWWGLSSARHLQGCSRSSGSAWAVRGAPHPNGILVASDVLRHALLERTTACLPYCKPSSANIMLKPDQELLVN